MDEFKILVYIIIGLIWVISRALKKKPQDMSTDNGDAKPVAGGGSKAPQMTFEDLLKEITEAKVAQPQPVQRTTPSQTVRPVSEVTETYVVDYDEDLKEEIQDLEVVGNEVDDSWKRNKIYEEGKRVAFNRATLEGTLQLSDTDMKFGKFKEFDQKEQTNVLQNYLSELQDPEGLKKAVIMSEILNRRF